MAGTPRGGARSADAGLASGAGAGGSDAEVLAGMMRDDGINGYLEPWDWRYYADKRRRAEHDLDEAALKPYLQLDRMIEAAFACANRLFGLEFAPVDVPLNHPDARAWEVTRDGRHMAVFVGDYFARSSKRSGAWCSAMRSQQKLAGEIRPIVVNVCNFAKPPAGQPALLSYDDARTLFHEFGHALHQMLSDVTYESVSGTSVARDFVELPSQLYEHWLEVPEVLAEFATHADTGAPMPRDLLERLLAAANFRQGFATVEYVASALVDLAFHDGPAPADVMAAAGRGAGRHRHAAVRSPCATPRRISRMSLPATAIPAATTATCGPRSWMPTRLRRSSEAGGAFDAATAQRLEEHILSVGRVRRCRGRSTPRSGAGCRGRGAAARAGAGQRGVIARLQGGASSGARPGWRLTRSLVQRIVTDPRDAGGRPPGPCG